MRPSKEFIALGVAAGVLSSLPCAFAQSRPDPADPAARVPAATYRSTFSDYRPLGDETVGDWRVANDEVRRIGGWREYAREVQASEAKPGAAPPRPAPGAPAPGGHAGHGSHAMPGANK